METTGAKPVFDIRERTLEYSIRAVEVFGELRKRGRAGYILGEEYLRSATSIGANLQEANAGESKADFIHKCAIAQKEASESLYWLRVVVGSGMGRREDLELVIQETREILAIITTILRRAKTNSHRG